MNNLQAQLLNAGLVDKKKVSKVQKDKFKKNRQQRSQNQAQTDHAKLAALQAIEEKKEKDRLLNQQKEEKARAKAIIAQIRQLILDNQQTAYHGTLDYNFQDNQKIKKIGLNEDIHRAVSQGKLAIVTLDNQYYLVAAGIAEKIAQRDPAYILVLNDKPIQDDTPDAYADYAIPDDLMW